MNIVILEDQYTPRIVQELESLGNEFTFPIRQNIRNPLDYLDFVTPEDIILLDNYFPGTGWEEALGDEFLKVLLSRQKTFHIIAISDRGNRLVEWYDGWRMASAQGWIHAWIHDKSGKEIFQTLKYLSCELPTCTF